MHHIMEGIISDIRKEADFYYKSLTNSKGNEREYWLHSIKNRKTLNADGYAQDVVESLADALKQLSAVEETLLQFDGKTQAASATVAVDDAKAPRKPAGFVGITYETAKDLDRDSHVSVWCRKTHVLYAGDGIQSVHPDSCVVLCNLGGGSIYACSADSYKYEDVALLDCKCTRVAGDNNWRPCLSGCVSAVVASTATAAAVVVPIAVATAAVVVTTTTAPLVAPTLSTAVSKRRESRRRAAMAPRRQLATSAARRTAPGTTVNIPSDDDDDTDNDDNDDESKDKDSKRGRSPTRGGASKNRERSRSPRSSKESED